MAKPLLPNPTHLLDTSWSDLDASAGYDDIEVDITVEHDPGETAFYYYSNTVYFPKAHEDTAGDLHGLAYAGLQTNGHSGEADRYVGKMAIFSAWDATMAYPADSGWATRFIEDGSGYSVRVPFSWTGGVTYRLRIGRAGEDAGNALWEATLTNVASGDVSLIGRIAVPGALAGIRKPITFHERYFGPSDLPSDIEPSQVVFSNVRANSGEVTSRHHNHIHAARIRGHRNLVWHEDLPDGVRSAVSTQRPT